MVKQNESAFKKILVASDSCEELLQAVEKAAMVEHYTGASVTVLLVIYDPVTEILVERYNPEASQRIVGDLIRGERQTLEAALAPCRRHIADLVAEVVFSRDTASLSGLPPVRCRSDTRSRYRAPPTRRHSWIPCSWGCADAQGPCPVWFTRVSKWDKPIPRCVRVWTSADRGQG